MVISTQADPSLWYLTWVCCRTLFIAPSLPGLSQSFCLPVRLGVLSLMRQWREEGGRVPVIRRLFIWIRVAIMCGDEKNLIMVIFLILRYIETDNGVDDLLFKTLFSWSWRIFWHLRTKRSCSRKLWWEKYYEFSPSLFGINSHAPTGSDIVYPWHWFFSYQNFLKPLLLHHSSFSYIFFLSIYGYLMLFTSFPFSQI